MPKRTSKGKENGFVALKMRVDELTGEVKQLKEERENCAFKFDQVLKGKRVCFVPVANRWKIIDSRWPCCENKCVNTDRPDVYCIKGNGYIQIKSDTYIKWINRRDDGSDKTVVIQSENLFNKPNEISASQQCFLDFITYSLFYYEVELQLEKAHHVFAIGLKNEFGFYVALLLNNQLYYFIKNKSDYIYFPKFNYKTGDVFGCGLVYPPPKMKDKLPYVFFTQNGKQIGKAISLKENCEYLNPYVQLENCSLETNFDSDFQPFVFDVSKYYVSEEFYNDEEFSGNKNQKTE